MTPKLVCFDLDGTLIDETKSIWATVHEALGTNTETRQKIMDDYFAGNISYSDWAEHDVAMWIRAGLTKKKLQEIISNFVVMKGAFQVLNKLKSEGTKLAIISGSLSEVVDFFFPVFEFDYVFINELIYDGQKILGVKPTVYDQHGKAEALRFICEKEGIDLKDTVFIGDHTNDVEIAKIAGLSIAFNSTCEKLREASDVIIKEKDLALILNNMN